MRLIRTILIVLAAFAVVGGVVAGGLFAYKRFFNPAEQALKELKALPLIGLVLADEPGVELRLRTAIEQEVRQPTQQGPSRPLQVVADLRRQYIAPALMAADDRSAIGALAAQAALIGYLLQTNTYACREFATGGIQQVDQLDAKAQQLFRSTLAAVEAAYRSGRKGGKPLPMPAPEEARDMLRESGFQKIDFDMMSSFATLSYQASCEIELKLYSAPATLPEAKRGAMARYILLN